MDQPATYAPTNDEKMTAMLAHVLQIFTWFIGPLVIFFSKRDSRFVAFHAIQALILQGFWLVMGVLLMSLWFGFFILIAATGGEGVPGSKGPPIAFFFVFILFWFAWVVAWVVTLVLSVLHGVKAVNGEWSQYPFIGGWARRLAKVDKTSEPSTSATPDSL